MFQLCVLEYALDLRIAHMLPTAGAGTVVGVALATAPVVLELGSTGILWDFTSWKWKVMNPKILQDIKVKENQEDEVKKIYFKEMK